MTDARERALRSEISAVCRKLWERGLVAGQDGNVSVRLGPDRILVTPSGHSKVDVSPDNLVVVNAAGTHVSGEGRASSELSVHLAAYARRADVHAVVHAHPPTATGLATAGQTLPGDILPEAVVLLGPVPLVRYAAPGTAELADRFEPYWADHDVFLMANHGALSLGATLLVAHQRMETLEHAASVYCSARAFGGPTPLSAHELGVLRDMRNRHNRK